MTRTPNSQQLLYYYLQKGSEQHHHHLRLEWFHHRSDSETSMGIEIAPSHGVCVCVLKHKQIASRYYVTKS